MFSQGRSENGNGFTLFEAIVALLLVGLVAISTLTTVGAQMQGEARARRSAEVESLAQERLMALQLLNAYELQSLPDSMSGGRFPYPLHAYSWEAVSRPVADEDFLNDIRVRIVWDGGSYTLATRIYQPPQAMNPAMGG